MDASDLGSLTDYDFESLCKDIFEANLGVRLEIFGPGRDGGIDLRHVGCSSQSAVQVIIQCKQWWRSRQSDLLSHFRRDEADKVHQLGNVRYILATTARINPAWKLAMSELLKPQLQSVEDLWGGDEIAHFLEGHPEIVRRHLRLWLNSSAVLQEALTADIEFRSRSLVQDVKESIGLYAKTSSHDAALVRLTAHKAVVITGVPGGGKTTLAHILLSEYGAMGYEIIDLSYSLRDADRAWREGAKQIFYIDDAFGPNLLDSMRARSASRDLLPLLSQIRSTPGKAVVVTTRDYILHEAQELNDRLDWYDVSSLQVRVDPDDLEEATRATILYNHVSQSELSPSHRAQFAEASNYQPILDSEKYSPRLIRLSLSQLAKEDYERAPAVILSNLQNPEALWGRLIEDQMDDDQVGLLISLLLLRDGAPASALERAWRTYRGRTAGPESSRLFRRILKRLEGTGVRDVSRPGQPTPLIAFHNPSIADYLLEYAGQHPEIVDRLLGTVASLEQARSVWQLLQTASRNTVQNGMLRHKEALCATLERLLLTRREQSDFNDIDVVMICIEYADFFGCEGLAEAIYRVLLSPDFEYEDVEEGLPDLVRELSESKHLILRSKARDIADLYVEYVESSLWGWQLLREAEKTLEELNGKSQTVSAAMQYVEESLCEVAADELDIWEGALEPPSGFTAWDELEDIVAWLAAKRLDLRGLDEARQALWTYRGVSNPQGAENVRVPAPTAESPGTKEVLGALAAEDDGES